MSLTVEQAAQAGELATKIRQRTALIEQLQSAIDGNWPISRLSAVGPGENEVSLVVGRMPADVSRDVLSTTLSVYQAELDGLNAQLAAIGA